MTKLENNVIEYLKKSGTAVSANDMMRSSEFYDTDFVEVYKTLTKLTESGEIIESVVNDKTLYRIAEDKQKTFPRFSSAVKSGPVLKNPLLEAEVTDRFDTLNLITDYEFRKNRD